LPGGADDFLLAIHFDVAAARTSESICLLRVILKAARYFPSAASLMRVHAPPKNAYRMNSYRIHHCQADSYPP
jgi:hypothetical protein